MSDDLRPRPSGTDNEIVFLRSSIGDLLLSRTRAIARKKVTTSRRITLQSVKPCCDASSGVRQASWKSGGCSGLQSILPTVDILDLLKLPEGKTLEFKLDLSSPDQIWRAIVAFANRGNGQTLTGEEESAPASKLNNPKYYFNEDNLRRAYRQPGRSLINFIEAVLESVKIKSRE